MNCDIWLEQASEDLNSLLLWAYLPIINTKISFKNLQIYAYQKYVFMKIVIGKIWNSHAVYFG